MQKVLDKHSFVRYYMPILIKLCMIGGFSLGDKRLSDTVSYIDDIQPHKLSLLYAGVGSGKNFFVNSLIKGRTDKRHDGTKAQLEPMTVLVITSRRSKVDELLTEDDLPADGKVGLWDDYHMTYDEEFEKVEITGKYIRLENEWGLPCTVFQRSVVCTNAFIEKYMQYRYKPRDCTTPLWDLFDLIVIDEAHALVTDTSYQSAPFYVIELINEYLRRHKAAEDDPEHNKAPLCKNLLMMTGSVAPMKKLSLLAEPHVIDRMEECINVRPKNIHFMSMEDARKQLVKQVENGEKVVYFCNHTPNIADFIEDTAIDPAKVALSFSKKEARDRLAKDAPQVFARMERVEKAIADDHLIPDDILLWLTTSRNKEGINIENKDIHHLYVENHIQSDIIQMAGRIREGVEHMYVIVDSQDNHSPEWTGEADFCHRQLAATTSSDNSSLDACNRHLKLLCTRNSITNLFNTRDAQVAVYDKKKGYPVLQDYINYVHDTFPYVRYSYIDNVFRFYKMRETSCLYQGRMLHRFKNAVKEAPEKLQRVFQSWFPTSTVHPYIPSEEAQYQAALNYLLSVGIFEPGRRFTQEEHNEMVCRLNQIYGTQLTSLTSLMKKCVPYMLKQVSRNSGTTCYAQYRCVRNPKATVQEPVLPVAA